MVRPEKIQRAMRLVEALENAHGVVDDVRLREDGNVELVFGDGDVSTTASGVVVKNGG